MFPGCTQRLAYHVNGGGPGGHLVDWTCRKIGYGGWVTGFLLPIADVDSLLISDAVKKWGLLIFRLVSPQAWMV